MGKEKRKRKKRLRITNQRKRHMGISCRTGAGQKEKEKKRKKNGGHNPLAKTHRAKHLTLWRHREMSSPTVTALCWGQPSNSDRCIADGVLSPLEEEEKEEKVEEKKEDPLQTGAVITNNTHSLDSCLTCLMPPGVGVQWQQLSPRP